MVAKHTIVIPTLANRPKELDRAITSLLTQHGNDAVPLVVVNGNRYDPGLLQHLRERRDIRFHQIDEPSVSGARYAGRKQIDTPYFGFLDDDDEYLPDALLIKHRRFETQSDVDVVVGNGWRWVGGKKCLAWRDAATIADSPADALVTQNWLASCGALFKTAAVGPEYFKSDLQYLEWTYLAFHLALTRKLSFVPEPTFIVHDTPNSVSDSDAYIKAQPAVLRHILELEMPQLIRKRLQRKLSTTYHNLSEHYRSRGMMGCAWRCHLRSILGIHGLLRHGLFTRKLLAFPPGASHRRENRQS